MLHQEDKGKVNRKKRFFKMGICRGSPAGDPTPSTTGRLSSVVSHTTTNTESSGTSRGSNISHNSEGGFGKVFKQLSQSEPVNELCSKILTRTDVKVRLSFPTAPMREHFKLERAQSVDFQVRDKNCKIWTFRLYTRKKDSHPQPVLTKGWIEFVQKNELRVGDKVIFLVHQNGDQLGIKVERAMTLMGREHWAELF